jgi:hypothetical protein
LPAFASRKVTTRLRLRDGESNLLAGLLREDERRSLRGFPGILRVPLLQQLFADNDTNIRQTDIVMLLTPRIVRSHQLTAADLSPIYIGTQSNMAVGGPPPVFGGGGEPAAAPAPAAPPAPGSGPPGAPVPPAPVTAPQVPFGSSPIPGTTTAPQPAPVPPAATSGIVTFPPPDAPVTPATPPQVAPVAPAPAAPPRDPGTAPPAAGQPAAAPPPAQVLLSPPGTEFRVGGGPYLVPVSISGATRLSSVSLSLTYNPSMLRVRTVQEGNLLRQGGIQATFTQKVDEAAGRVDIAVVRPGDVLGVSGTGVVAALLVEAIGPGTSPLAITGVGSLAGGGAAPLQFQSLTVTVK